ncbi:MAG: permease, partial [Candidatus Omnitrophica bacterium]|nr:permease [Candidatus Omnitrophota bacterium]
MKRELKILSAFIGIFLVAYFLPLGNPKVSNAILEAFNLLQWYARQHTLACVVPAMFIAGAITTFLSQASVLNYLGPKANRPLSYGVGAVSGFILAVCSCSVLPMFAGIYALGAGLGPACAFLYSGPAINVMAVFLSARVLGADIGIARTVGAVVFAVVIGLLMAFIFRKDDKKRNEAALQLPDPPPSPRRLWQTTLFMLCMILFLMFSDWYNTNDVS